MFNDLTGSQDQGSSKVDDIFADTDKAPVSASSASQIETRPAGLSAASSYQGQGNMSGAQMAYADDEESTGGNKGKILKIAIIAAVAAILILGGYLVYSKFLAPKAPENTNLPVDSLPEEQTPAVVDEKDDGFVNPSAGKDNTLATSTEDEKTVTEEPIKETIVDTDLDGLSDAEEVALGTNPALIDSDGDSLSDFIEVKSTQKTDPMKADTDGDGLNDYEEINNWGTDPLIADTDGDGYDDGSEVKAGYNPRGDGKLPGTAQ